MRDGSRQNGNWQNGSRQNASRQNGNTPWIKILILDTIQVKGAIHFVKFQGYIIFETDLNRQTN